MQSETVDVVILGAGMAGLTLARQLLLNGDKRILHLEKKAQVPGRRQKVGESNVQVAGYYLGKVLGLEEYLFHEQLMKYNLRFMWKTPGLANDDFADYGQSYIRKFSNIPCYQLDRNSFEAALIEMNRGDEDYRLITGAGKPRVKLNSDGPHEVQFEHEGQSWRVRSEWVVDCTGRARKLAGDMKMKKTSDIKHGATYFWLDGTVNIESMTRARGGPGSLRRHKRSLGHLPYWLATNHFMGEGFWFWVIPLKGRTSFGLVYDESLISPASVNTKEKMLTWLFATFPLFREQLEGRELIDFSTLRGFSHDCHHTIHGDRWAMSGESGRFTDPLYSPGGDTIAIHNTLITDAILSRDQRELNAKIGLYEGMFKTAYFSFVPSYATGYGALGDQETFAMKYTWELSVYFAFYVFPFINELLVERHFLIPYLRRFSQLGEANRTVQAYIADYFNWRKQHPRGQEAPIFFDFTEESTLNRAEETFYKLDLTTAEAVAVLDEQLDNLLALARMIIAHIDAAVTGRPDLLTHSGYVTAIDPCKRTFDESHIRATAMAAEDGPAYAWRLDPGVWQTAFGRTSRHEEAVAVAE